LTKPGVYRYGRDPEQAKPIPDGVPSDLPVFYVKETADGGVSLSGLHAIIVVHHNGQVELFDVSRHNTMEIADSLDGDFRQVDTTKPVLLQDGQKLSFVPSELDYLVVLRPPFSASATATASATPTPATASATPSATTPATASASVVVPAPAPVPTSTPPSPFKKPVMNVMSVSSSSSSSSSSTNKLPSLVERPSHQKGVKGVYKASALARAPASLPAVRGRRRRVKSSAMRFREQEARRRANRLAAQIRRERKAGVLPPPIQYPSSSESETESDYEDGEDE
jgi:hypothetical protein